MHIHPFTKSMQHRLTLLVLFVFTSAGAASCGSSTPNLFSKSEDVQLGQQMQQQIAADPTHYPLLNNPTLLSYLQSIENRIVSSPNVQNKDFQYTVSIINDPNTVNAFSIPGGHMYVYTGLLKFVDNEATLAAVLAHETTHADHRHATRLMTQQYGLQVITGLALGQNSGTISQIVAGLAGNLSILKFSRDDEREADQGSFDDLNQLPGKPWYPAAIAFFMEKAMATEQSQPSKVAQLLQDHPVDQERLNTAIANAQKAGLPPPNQAPASQLGAETYARYKAMVP